MKEIVLAFAGQPNCGKTTLFNAITGSHQHVGNWPGVTVEYKEGSCVKDDITYKIIDLPGLYSMSANSYEEIVSKDFLIKEKVDIVVNIVDSSILERSLFLTTQLMEIGLPMMMIFNMEDILKAHNIQVDFEKISESLNIPYITSQGSKTKSFDKFFQTVNEIYDHKEFFIPRYAPYSGELESHIQDIQKSLQIKNPFCYYNENDQSADNHTHIYEHHEHDVPRDIFIKNSQNNPIRLRWYVVRAFLGDLEAIKFLQNNSIRSNNLATQIDIKKGHISEVYGESLNEIITDDRYGYVGGITGEYVQSENQDKPTLTDKADKILLNKWLGFPFFALIMYLTFSVAFTLGDLIAGKLSDLINLGIDYLDKSPIIGNSFLNDMICDGVLTGVGAVVVFIPTIAFMFVMIAILEDSGYMSRAAFLTDRAMHAMGLHGKSFISMLLGFGCNIPGIMAARTLESRADKIVTIMLNPLMSCSGRLPIYVFFTAIFFEAKYRSLVIMSIYLIGVVLAIIVGKFFRSKLFDTKESPFVMEMPTYRLPTLKGVFIHSWERTKEFLVRAGTIIVLISILIWFLSTYPNPDNSYIYMAGKWLGPVMKPIGLDWQAAVSCLFGIGAKEIVVSAMQIMAGNGGDIGDILQQTYTPLQSYIFMVFTLIYCPCLATIVTMKKEIGEIKYFIIAVLYPIILAWVICFLIWQISQLIL